MSIETISMPDICFHFSSQRAHENGLTGGDDKTRISMPIEPAIQIPNTAKPTCYLHNMAFSNNIANVNATDGSNQITLSTGSSACKFHQGTTYKPWIGVKYKRKVGSTFEDFRLIAPEKILSPQASALNKKGHRGRIREDPK